MKFNEDVKRLGNKKNSLKISSCRLNDKNTFSKKKLKKLRNKRILKKTLTDKNEKITDKEFISESIKFNNVESSDKVIFEENPKILKFDRIDKKIKYTENRKNKAYKKIKKKQSLKFKESEIIFDEESNKYNLKTKFKPSIKAEINHKKSDLKRVENSIFDISRNKIHRKVYESEEDNISLKAIHTVEVFFENKAINHLRNENNRRILKFENYNKKLKKLEDKKDILHIKKEFKNDKIACKKAMRKRVQQKKLHRKMQKKKLNELKKVTRFKDFIYFSKFNNKIFNILLSFKVALISMVLLVTVGFFILVVMALIMLFSASYSNIEEIQKAELYYTRLESIYQDENVYKAYLNNNFQKYKTLRLDVNANVKHNPIYLASYLTLMFGDFRFEEVKDFLEELIQREYKISEEKKTYEDIDLVGDKYEAVHYTFTVEREDELEHLILRQLSEDDYEVWKMLNETKGNMIIFGSPFKEDYEKNISSYMGFRVNPTNSSSNITFQFHKGLDIAMTGGTEILAIGSGIVTRANYSDSFGNIVEILHDDGYVSKYAHQQRLNVRIGQKVKQGEVIGFVGSTGDSTGNHLHLEIYKEGVLQNPIFFINYN